MTELPFMAQESKEFQMLLEAMAGSKLILEIGTCRDGTLYRFMREADDKAIFISIDMPGGKYGGELGQPDETEMQSWKRPGQTLHIIREDSHADQTLKKVKALLKKRKFDFALIDGDHTYEGVKKDFEMYGPLVKGMVAFHDICHHPNFPDVGVEKFWNELEGEKIEIINDPNQGWAGIGVIINN